MHKSILKSSGALAILFLTLISFSCNPQSRENYKGIISVSILPQKYFVEKIAGPGYRINVLIPPGASPASYEPLPGQVNELSRSDIYFRIGRIAFEKAWISTLQKNNPDVQFIDLSSGIQFIAASENHGDHRHEGEDPHIWMSPVNVSRIAQNIFRALKTAYPADSQLFYANLQDFLVEIDEVDSAYRDKSSLLEGKNFLIYHPALAYLARDYGMIQHELEYEGKEPPPSHIAGIIKEARKHDINLIFIQKQFNMDNARSLAREIDAEIVMIDPLNEDWKTEMLSILEKLTL